MQCANQLKQVGLALPQLPLSQRVLSHGAMLRRSKLRLGAGSVYILPYLEKTSLFDSIDFTLSGSYWQGKNITVTKTLIADYMCPSDPQYGELIWVTGATPKPDAAMTSLCGVSDTDDWTTGR